MSTTAAPSRMATLSSWLTLPRGGQAPSAARSDSTGVRKQRAVRLAEPARREPELDRLAHRQRLGLPAEEVHAAGHVVARTAVDDQDVGGEHGDPGRARRRAGLRG